MICCIKSGSTTSEKDANGIETVTAYYMPDRPRTGPIALLLAATEVSSKVWRLAS